MKYSNYHLIIIISLLSLLSTSKLYSQKTGRYIVKTTECDSIETNAKDNSTPIYSVYTLDTLNYSMVFQNQYLLLCYKPDTSSKFAYDPNLLLDYFDPKYSKNIDVMYDLFKSYYTIENKIIGPTNKLFSRFRVDAIYDNNLLLKNIVLVINIADKDIARSELIEIFANSKFLHFVEAISLRIKRPNLKIFDNPRYKKPENIYRYSMPIFNSVFW